MGIFGGHKPTMLVVEDSEDLYEAIEESLKRNDFNILHAASFDDAVKFLDEEKDIEVAWVDHYIVGDKTGLDLIHELREREKYKDVPVIVVTVAEDETVKEYVKAGVSKCYVKSENKLQDIIDDVENFLKAFRQF